MCIYLYRKFQQRSRSASQGAKTEQTRCSHLASTPATEPSPLNPQRPSKCAVCATEKRAVRKYRYKLLFFLLPAFFLASIDLTIVATALPFIASHFDKFNQLNWIVTAYTLTSTVFIPVFGQLSDTFGRHSGLQLALAISVIGSVLCAVAPLWPVLLLGRALQGVGSAGVENICMIVLGDAVSLKEQAVNISIFQLMNGVAYSVGPVIGGHLTNANWRYNFVLCAGMGAVSMVTVFLLRTHLKPGKVSVTCPSNGRTRIQTVCAGLATLDIGGVVLFITGAGLIILGTAWGGSTFPWKSAPVIVSLVLGFVLLLSFGTYEYLLEPGRLLSKRLPKTVPVLPFDLLRKKDVFLVCFMAASAGAALYSAFYFISIYFTLAKGYPASRAGIQLLYYMPGLGIGVYGAIFLCNKWPGQTFWPLISGSIIEMAGIAALTYAVHTRNSTLVNFVMALAGVGTGARFMPANLHLGGMFRDRLAPVYSLLRFALPFGGTLALTIMGSVFQNNIASLFRDSVTSGSGNATSSAFDMHNQAAALESISSLPPAEEARVRAGGAEATMWAFIAILPFLALGLVAAVGLGNVWISENISSTTNEDGISQGGSVPKPLTSGEKSSDGPAITGWILDSVYLVALMKGTVRTERRRPPVPDSVGQQG